MTSDAEHKDFQKPIEIKGADGSVEFFTPPLESDLYVSHRKHMLALMRYGLRRAYSMKAKQLRSRGLTAGQMLEMFENRQWVPPGRLPMTKEEKEVARLSMLPPEQLVKIAAGITPAVQRAKGEGK